MRRQVEYEVVWSGSTHRQYPQPVVAVPEPRPSVPEACMARLWVCLHDGWQSRAAIRDRAQMDARRVTEYLHRLVEQGRVEKHIVANRPGHRGRPAHFYRRRRQTQEAA